MAVCTACSRAVGSGRLYSGSASSCGVCEVWLCLLPIYFTKALDEFYGQLEGIEGGKREAGRRM